MRRTTVGAAIAVGLLSCATDPVEPIVAEGEVHYVYDGEVSGSFDVVGAYSENPVDRSFTVARPTVQGDKLGLFALRLRGEVTDVLHILIPLPAAPGIYPVEYTSFFHYGMDGPGAFPEYSFEIESGQVVVTAHNGGRIQGSFEASGVAYGGPGWDPFNPETSNVEITGGTFDLPVVPLE